VKKKKSTRGTARDGLDLTERFNKDFLAKPVLSKAEGTPSLQRWQRKVFFYFSELGALCAFARVILLPIFSSIF